MSLRLIGFVALTLLVAVGGWFLAQGDDVSIEPAPELVLAPPVPSLEVDLNNRFVERLIVEDEEIQAALRGETLVKDVTGTLSDEDDLWAKTNVDILFEQMAPWVYINYRKLNEERSGQFLNTSNQTKSPYLAVGATFGGAKIETLDPEKAVVRFADATQELYLVSETPPPFDPTVPRTPEQIAEAQLRYREFYMKKFIVSGKEYDRRRGRKAAVVPPRSEQVASGIDYLDQAQKFAERSENAVMPPEANIDVNQLPEEQRALYESYRALFNRTPEQIQDAIRAQRAVLEGEQATLEGGAAGTGGTAPGSN